MEKIEIDSFVETKQDKVFDGKYRIPAKSQGYVVDIKDDRFFMVEVIGVSFENRSNLFTFSRDEISLAESL